MTFTLWRSICIDLLRLSGIAAAVLVGVIAFAAAVKPMSDGTLPAGGAVKFMALAALPMAAYAVPFAVAFGATLVYLRMGQDNEVVAALSGGISHRRLLVPAMTIGLGVSAGLFALNEFAIPRLLRSMERMITLDVAEVLVRRIERGEAANLGRTIIYADGVNQLRVPAGSSAVAWFELDGVVAVETDDDGRVEMDLTAQSATIALYESVTAAAGGASEVALFGRVEFKDGVFREPEQLSVGDVITPPFRIDDAFRDDPKFLTFGELRRLVREPERMGFVREQHARVARVMAQNDAATRVSRSLIEIGRVELTSGGGGGGGGDDSVGELRVSVRAERARPDGTGELTLSSAEGGVIEVEATRQGGDGADAGRPRVYRAAAASLRPSMSRSTDGVALAGAGEGLTWTLVMRDVAVIEPGGAGVQAGSAREEVRLERLALADDRLPELMSIGSLELIERAERAAAEAEAAGRVGQAAAIRGAVDNGAGRGLRPRIEKMNREVMSKVHERGAMSLAPVVMGLAGAATALRLKRAMPLVVYLWSFVPSLVAFILISAGQQETHGNGALTGLPQLWGGLVALGVYGVVSLVSVGRG